MHEQKIADYLDLMLESIKLIEDRFMKIRLPGEFVQSAEGTTLLDAISMRLQVIGESVRKIQNCSGIDLSRPRFTRICWISSSVEVAVASISAGSPETRTMTNISTAIPNSAITDWSNRIVMKRTICSSRQYSW